MDKWWCDKFEDFRTQTIMSSCLVDQDLTNDISNLLRFNFRYDKTCSGAKPGWNKINFFHFESSKTESLGWSSFPSCSRVLVKKSLNSLAKDDSSYTVHFPSLIPRLQSFLCQSHLGHSKYLQDSLNFRQLPQKKKDRFDLGSSAFSVGVMIPIFLLVCLSHSSEQLLSCFYAFMNFSCHPGRLSLSFHSLCFQWNNYGD